MGSVRMAVDKILAVFLAVAGQCAWTVPQFSTTTSTTPVPILRYIDRQNTDGSYTFGFEGADGTYKLETRHPDGRVKGKYGYFDPEGVFREATYGAEAGRGFEPKIDGLELPPPTIVQKIENEIPQTLEPVPVVPQKFENFSPKDSLPKESAEVIVDDRKIKIVNGRRAVLKKRLKVKPTPAPERFIAPKVQRENNLKARQNQLKQLEEHRRQLILLQRKQNEAAGARQSSLRSFNGFRSNPQESIRSGSGVSDPFISGLDLSSGSYSYAYRR